MSNRQSFGDNRYEIGVRDNRALGSTDDDGDISTGIYTLVFDADTKTLATLFSDSVRTPLTNPISRSQYDSDGKLKFFAAAESVDIFYAHSDGSIGFQAGLSSTQHSLLLDRAGSDKMFVIPFSALAAETDSGVDIPIGTLIKDAKIFVRTLDAGETLDVGLLSSESGGDADGFLDGISVNAAGWVEPLAYTVGSNETFLATILYGVLMGSFAVGTDVNTDTGVADLRGHQVTGSGAQSVTYTGSAGGAAGEIYLQAKVVQA